MDGWMDGWMDKKQQLHCTILLRFATKNLAIANRPRVNCAHNTSKASISSP